jgi:pilus assembly protein Flp/PilA
MSHLIESIRDRFDRREDGATMVEYGLLVALIAVVVLVALGPLGQAVRDLFSDVDSTIQSVPGDGGAGETD